MRKRCSILNGVKYSSAYLKFLFCTCGIRLKEGTGSEEPAATVTDLQLAALRALLVSFLSFARERPPYFSQGLEVVSPFDPLYDETLPAFDIVGKKSFFLGKVGNGAKMKLVVNMIMGSLRNSMMNAFSEGLTLAERSGLNPANLHDVLDLGAISNGMFKLKAPTMLQNSYSPAFPLKHQQKDKRLALALGDANSVSMPVAAAANEMAGGSNGRRHVSGDETKNEPQQMDSEEDIGMGVEVEEQEEEEEEEEG
ncbi:hypothetical protein VNO80_00640 [Phaseolus coccineus]|uniref:3-hydroxyisobutyrate dehydrogenase-like NAD-binding domain-containing protein n=1 Tax=Phaseolus coccineus TaxID=3886 RepID=A0AAN9RQI4_PHACN